MNKEYFLQELEFLLSDISQEEREAALSYYRDYFDEAGTEHEQEVLARIGSPEKVAAELRVSLAGDKAGGVYTEHGYYDERFDEKHRVPDLYTKLAGRNTKEANRKREQKQGQQSRQEQQGWQNRQGQQSRQERQERQDWQEQQDWQGQREYQGERRRAGADRRNGLLLILLLLFFGIPMARAIISAGFSVIGGILGAVFGVFGGLIGLVIGGFAAVLGLVIAGVSFIATGAANMAMLPVGFICVCIGLFLLAAAMLAAVAAKWGCTTAIPGLFSFAADLVRRGAGCVERVLHRLFGRGGEAG